MSDTTAVSSTGKRILNMTYIAMFAALMAVCAWIAVPIATIPITLQTFGVFCAVGLLGGKRGTLAILVYILPDSKPVWGCCSARPAATSSDLFAPRWCIG